MKVPCFTFAASLFLVVAMAVAAPVSAVSVTEGTTKVEKHKNLKGINKVGVPQYNISFATEDGKMAVAEAKGAKGMFGAFTGTKATASAYARIAGLSEVTMQGIVDKAYADLLERLKAAGIEVDDGAYEKIQNHQYVVLEQSPVKNRSYYRAFNNKLNDTTVAPSGMKVIKANSNSLGLVADEIDTTLLNVEYLLHFGHFGAETKSHDSSAFSAGSASARVTLGQGIQVHWNSGFTVVNGHENAFNKPNARVLVHKNFYSTTPYGNTSKDSASGGKKGLGGLWNAGFVGGDRYVIEVVEEEYAEVALEVLKKVNAALVNELVANR